MPLSIVYQDEYLIAINKPHGLLVHRSSLAKDVKEFALQQLRNQVGKHVFPIHRLDRKTSGLLLFACSSEIAKLVQRQFENQEVGKRYLAIVRGYFPEKICCAHPLLIENKGLKDCLTDFACLRQSELPIPMGKYQSSRYSLIEAFPRTGRQHQIRRHLNHLRHPIIGDRPHGCNKQNRLFKERWQLKDMLLHAVQLHCIHPVSKQPLLLKAPLSKVFQQAQQFLNLQEPF